MQNGHATTEIYGGGDVIKGSLWNDDYLNGGAGNDSLYGYWASRATIIGGAGDDYIDAGAGSDTIYGGAGDDRIFAGAGNDTIYCGPGTNQIDGGPGTDTAVFAGNYAGCGLSFANGVTKAVGIEGILSLTNIETIKFNDGFYNVLAELFQVWPQLGRYSGFAGPTRIQIVTRIRRMMRRFGVENAYDQC